MRLAPGGDENGAQAGRGLPGRGMDDKAEEDGHGRSGELGRELAGARSQRLHVAVVDPARHLADDGHGLAVAVPGPVQIDLNLLAVQLEEGAVQDVDLDAVAARQAVGCDVSGEVLEGESDGFAEASHLMGEALDGPLGPLLGFREALDGGLQAGDAVVGPPLGLRELLKTLFGATLRLGQALNGGLQSPDALLGAPLGLSQSVDLGLRFGLSTGEALKGGADGIDATPLFGRVWLQPGHQLGKSYYLAIVRDGGIVKECGKADGGRLPSWWEINLT
jgi:hypothetical protein